MLSWPSLNLGCWRVGTCIPRCAAPCLSEAGCNVLCSSCCNSSLETSFLQIRPSKGMVLKFPPSATTSQTAPHQIPTIQTSASESSPLPSPLLHWYQINPISLLYSGTSRSQHSHQEVIVLDTGPPTIYLCVLHVVLTLCFQHRCSIHWSKQPASHSFFIS